LNSWVNVDPYEVLDVPHDATLEQIRGKRLRLLKKLHPDVAGADPDLKSYFDKTASQINRAWEILGDPVKRAQYDVAHSPPRLVVLQPNLDVEVESGQDAIIRFRVDNTGGPVPQGKRLAFSSPDKKMSVDLRRCESVNHDTLFPIEVELLLSTSELPEDIWQETNVEVLLEDM